VAPADADIVRGLTDGLDSLCQLGGARLGDKTMVDAYVPFVDALRIEIGNVAGLPGAWEIAAQACEQAARDTESLTPKVGRARPLAQRSVGTADAGATSLALCVRAVSDVVAVRG